MNEKDDIGLLIRQAGARESVSPERLARARARVDTHWQSVVATRHGQRRTLNIRHLAMAASVVVAIAVGLLLSKPDMPPAGITVATVNRVVGTVRIDGEFAVVGQAISADSVIETLPDGRIALELASGHSLRVDSGSELIAGSDHRYSLPHGAVFVDSGPTGQPDSVFIATHLGVASDIGTQFQVRVSADSVLIGVREGLVELQRDDAPAYPVKIGRIAEFSEMGDVHERDVDPEDDIWQWTSSIVPNFDIEGATLHQYLTWYARERGVQLEWHDAVSRQNGDRIVLSGSIEGLSLDDGLQVVLKIAPFEHVLVDGVMTVQVD